MYMIEQVDTLIKEISTKPTWSAKEILPKLHATSQLIENQLSKTDKLISVFSSKKHNVLNIKKYDMLYLALVGMPHYFLVHKVVRGIVYGIIFTSTEKKPFCIHEITKDRTFLGNYATNTYMSVTLEEALKSFVRVFECKAEADEIFNKVTDQYRHLFKIKLYK